MIRQRLTFFLFLACYLYFFIGGILSYWVANYFTFAYYDFNYQIDLLATSVYALAGLVCFLLAYATFSKLMPFSAPERPDPAVTEGYATSIHLSAVLALFFLGCVGLILMCGQYNWQIPIFFAGSDEFRTKIGSGLPQILYFQLVVSALIACSLIPNTNSAIHRRFLVIIIFASLFLILLGASRSMFFTPLAVILLDLWRNNRIRARLLVVGTFISAFGAFMIGLFRMGGQVERGVYLLRFVSDFAPEFREFARVLQHIPDKVPYLNGQMFLNTIFILFPGKVLSIFGMTKAEHWVPFGQYLKELFQYEFQGGGLRAGLIAEYYANFGVIGIIVGFYLMGLLVRYLDLKMNRAQNSRQMFYLIVGFSVASSVLFTFDGVAYKLVSLAAGWVLYYCIVGCLKALFAKPGRPAWVHGNCT